jgi:hypothetical protein
MPTYTLPQLKERPAPEPNTAVLVANGDLRLSANQVCWPAQEAMEAKVVAAFAAEGITVKRGHAYDPELKHGFIWNQRMGMDVFTIHPDTPLIVAESVWQYSHHRAGRSARPSRPIPDRRQLERPVARAGRHAEPERFAHQDGREVQHASGARNFTDDYFRSASASGSKPGQDHPRHQPRARPESGSLPAAEAELGQALARQLQREKAIIGVFDEGCMGMYNAIIDDEMLNPLGIYKERLSQSALVRGHAHGQRCRSAGRNWLDKAAEPSSPARRPPKLT